MLFNAHAGELWRRFTTYLPRHLAALAGLPVTWLRDMIKIRYVKVTEYQARGVVHFHAVFRLDAARHGYQPPSPLWTAELLCQAIQDAADAVFLGVDPGPARDVLVLAFGRRPTPGLYPAPARRCPPPETRYPATLWPTTSPSTSQDPHRPGSARPAASKPAPTSPGCAATGTTGR